MKAQAETVVEIIAHALDVMKLDVMPGAQLRNDLGADDDDIDRLRRTLATAMGCFVTPEDAAAWVDVGDVLAYVERRMNV